MLLALLGIILPTIAQGAAPAINFGDKSAVASATAENLASAVKAQVEAARKSSTNSSEADAVSAAIVREVFSQLTPGDSKKAAAIIAALAHLPGLNFVQLTYVASSSQPALAETVENTAKVERPDQAAKIAAAMRSLPILNRSLGSGPGSSNVSANVAVLSGGIQSEE